MASSKNQPRRRVRALLKNKNKKRRFPFLVTPCGLGISTGKQDHSAILGGGSVQIPSRPVPPDTSRSAKPGTARLLGTEGLQVSIPQLHDLTKAVRPPKTNLSWRAGARGGFCFLFCARKLKTVFLETKEQSRQQLVPVPEDRMRLLDKKKERRVAFGASPEETSSRKGGGSAVFGSTEMGVAPWFGCVFSGCGREAAGQCPK